MAEQHDKAPDPDSGRGVLAQLLKFLREKSGKSLTQLAEETGYERSYLNRLENGYRLSKLPVMEDLDNYYGTGDLLVKQWKVAQLDAFKDQYKEFMRREATARVMWKFSLGVPGLLQTEDFARESLSWLRTTAENDDEFEVQVTARLGRQHLLQQKPRPSVRFIIDEYALRRAAAVPKTWSEQLCRIEAVAMWPNVTFQVLPFSSGVHHHMESSLTLLWQKDGNTAAYTESNTMGKLTEDPDEVLRHRLSYDRLRDLASSPSDSLTFLRNVMEEHRT
ncbi:helix-turn-helix domain-containing protein [Streptomyces acidiscabies]|uniref:helix-turn-helix domain-containing protein n=1 Tax=Streptomyces acidiscabies TaxID=42234 RepID=UPI00095332D2|nr:helix-turn-helix transcriptional regulator [Streptomyces acidiscabies]